MVTNYRVHFVDIVADVMICREGEMVYTRRRHNASMWFNEVCTRVKWRESLQQKYLILPLTHHL